MERSALKYGYTVVALRKESVDRNSGRVRTVMVFCGRSPQGERG